MLWAECDLIPRNAWTGIFFRLWRQTHIGLSLELPPTAVAAVIFACGYVPSKAMPALIFALALGERFGREAPELPATQSPKILK